MSMSTKSIRPADLLKLRDFLSQAMGLYFSNERLHELETSLIGAVSDLGFNSIDECVVSLLSYPLTQERTRKLASHLTVGETYFFRDQKLFTYLEEDLLPGLMLRSRLTGNPLRIWSAGCCTGEEAYSIAILLSRLQNLKRDKVELFASDINPKFLARAASGTYTSWSFRGVPQSIKTSFFNATSDKRFSLKPPLKSLVQFSYANIVDDFDNYSILSKPMDIIICRNVLIYFSEEKAVQTIRRFKNLLVPGGILILAPVEVGLGSSELKLIQHNGVILLQNSPHGGKHSIQDHTQSGTILARLERPQLSLLDTDPIKFVPKKSATEITSPPPVLLPQQHSSTEETGKLYTKAKAFFDAGNNREVIDLLLPLAEAGEGNNEIFALLSQAMTRAKDLPGAINWIGECLKKDKLNPSFHYLHALLLQNSGHLGQAIQSVQKALFIDPSFVIAHFVLANMFLQSGKPEKAKKHFQNCLSLLEEVKPETILPHSDGMNAMNLKSLIISLVGKCEGRESSASEAAVTASGQNLGKPPESGSLKAMSK